MAMPTMQEMLEAGVHFGHQTRRWNPKMKRFILGERNGIHVINLSKTLEGLAKAQEAIRTAKASGRRILFVGTKDTARASIEQCAAQTGEFFVTKRWLGGMLTNFATVRNSIRRIDDIEKMEADGLFKQLTKKEVLTINRERAKLMGVFRGIREMKDLPALVVVSDIKFEHIAIAEARRLGIPTVAICDTNVDPELVDFPVPGNDDAVKSIELLLGTMVAPVAGAPEMVAKLEIVDKDA